MTSTTASAQMGQLNILTLINNPTTFSTIFPVPIIALFLQVSPFLSLPIAPQKPNIQAKSINQKAYFVIFACYALDLGTLMHRVQLEKS